MRNAFYFTEKPLLISWEVSMILKFWQLIKDYIRKLFTVNMLKLVPDIFGKKVKIRQCIQKGLLHIVQFERVLSKILGIRLR